MTTLDCVDVRALFADLGVSLPAGGPNVSVSCFAPGDVHRNGDRSPSASVNVETGAWLCHGCGAKGGAYDAALAQGRAPGDAMELLKRHGLVGGDDTPRRGAASRSGGDRPPAALPDEATLVQWQQDLQGHAKLLKRLEDRNGWTARALAAAGAGWGQADGWREKRLVFPINDTGGELINVVGYLPGGEPKSLALRGRPRDIFPPVETIEGHEVTIVEGEGDAVSMNVFELPAVAIPGTGAATGFSKYAARFALVDRVNVSMDCDPQGRGAREAIAAALHAVGVDVRVLDIDPGRDDGYDVGDMLREASEFGADGVASAKKALMALAREAVSWSPPGDVVSEPAHEATSGVADEIAVPATSETPVGETDRYAGRIIDLDALLAKPPEPIPWRVQGVVADGTLTIVSGESGGGKSWLAQALCTGVARGQAMAGILCVKGIALYIDAEMGPRMFVDQRLRPTGATTAEFQYIDAMGLDISMPDDLVWVRRQVEKLGANLVVIDSLRRLTPSKSENDSDDMAPAVSALAKLARDTKAAVVLIHHKGDSEKFFRGSSAIKDQADALFALLRDPNDEDAPRTLSCGGGRGKMRYAPEPADVFLGISPECGGVESSSPPENPGPQVPAREAVAAAIKAALPAATKTEVARKVGRAINDRTFRDAWRDLEEAGEIAENSRIWEGSSHRQPLDNMTTTTPLHTEGRRREAIYGDERAAA
ncbi:AAA family ATPase [Capillimicrobium parvum]|uniref:AAA family ATPase n=1 Tax=Capillimicrobium parvum TaxID=2884022 RepID=A0A9E7C0C3_9ACTN|nr:AAA family ATPase [Capillimicrobium parvum]UGS35248.1 hypothetical protein DSM104329_01634 [Capillimicrobium parvum]